MKNMQRNPLLRRLGNIAQDVQYFYMADCFDTRCYGLKKSVGNSKPIFTWICRQIAFFNSATYQSKFYVGINRTI